MNVPNVTQVRPDLLVPVLEGPHGAGFHFLEYERQLAPWRVEAKLRLYRRMAQSGRTLPVLVVCDTERAQENYLAAGRGLSLLATTLERALTGPLTGSATVWRSADHGPAPLHCRRGRR